MNRFFYFILFYWIATSPLAALQLQNLKVEYTICPIGIDISKPRFSWQMFANAGERNIKQKAYRLRVYNPDNICIWDSGKTNDDRSINIRYQGKNLQPATQYHWQVDVWPNHGKPISARSWFETGLTMQQDSYNEWEKAQWIGGGKDNMVLYSHYLPVFRLNYAFCLDSLSEASQAAFIYGANDERLMDSNKNLFGLAARKNESYIKIEINTLPLREGQEAEIRIFRVGFSPEDKKDIPFRTFAIPQTLLNQMNKYQEHMLTIASELGYTRIFFDGNAAAIGEANLNPFGQGGDFTAFPVVGDVGFYNPAGKQTASARIEVCNFRSPQNKLSVTHSPLPISANDKTGNLCLTSPSKNASPMLRTTFSTGRRKVVRARLYITSRGIYDAYINGKRIGTDYFNPGASQYNRTHFYQTFDVTPYIRQGKNALGAILAEGWWSGGCTFTGNNWNYFGDRQSLLAKLKITYEDGKTETIVTNPHTWKYFDEGPIIYGSLFQGEIYDATREKETEGWSTASYDDSMWKLAQIVPLAGTISEEGGGNSPKVNDYSRYRLTGQLGSTVKAVNELTAQSVEEVRPGVFVYDMGQNMVGVPRITLSGQPRGKKIYLRFAEVKYPSLPRYKEHEGMIMTENIRAAMAQDIYITRGAAQETIAPRFTYHGYRFIEITGIDQALPLEAVKGTVLSSVEQLASHYETSNPKVNQLWRNITWSTFGNFLSIPTDCPQRNERMGWAGDISVFSPTATYLTDAALFLRRYLQAMRDVQREDGRFPDIAPLGGGFGGMLWGSAGIVIPWECYRQYQDKDLLAEHYPAMKRYICYLTNKCINPETRVLEQEKVWGNLGDWLSPEDNRNDATLLWEAYFIHDLDIMQRVADILEDKEGSCRYGKLKKERTEFFNRTYIDPETGKTRSADGKRPVDTQASYALPLAFGIIPQSIRPKMTDHLAATVTRVNTADNGVECPPYSLMTGFIGTAWICKALSDNGRTDIAYRLLQQTGYPSWLYPVEQGATTIWERLNSYTHTDGFGENNRMNSFNHYSFGSVGAWMYGYSLGIQPTTDEPQAAFKQFILKPQPDPTGLMTFARGHYDSMYGRIESGWEITPTATLYTFSIPANTTATLYLPAQDLSQVKEDDKRIKNRRRGITVIGQEGNYIRLRLESGNYRFKVEKTH